jgi:glycerophosphoryl diester phosphodiesterase
MIFRILFISILTWSTTTAFARPIVIAHRGASAYLPEHTLEAKALAYGLGADYIEQDVILTKDGVPIILHDINLGDVTDVAKKFPNRKRKDGKYYAIDFSLKEIKQLTVTERFKPETGVPVYSARFPIWKSNFKISTLSEEIELIQGLNKSMKRDVGIYVEVKKPAFHLQSGLDISRIVVNLLAEYDYPKTHKNVYFQCFDAAELKRVHAWKTGLPLIQLIGENAWGESKTDYDVLKTKKGIADIATYAIGIGPWMGQLYLGMGEDKKPKTSNLVAIAHAVGLKVHPYTLRADQLPEGITFQQALDFLFKMQKVDGVFTDFPDLALSYLKK